MTPKSSPYEQVKKLGELGFLGMMTDPKYKGSGMDTLSYVIAMEELSKIDASASVIVSVNNSLVCWGLEAFGNEAQKQKYLLRLAAGEVIGAFCLSEPEVGSDATSQKTTAIDKVGPLCSERDEELDHQWRHLLHKGLTRRTHKARCEDYADL